jgi:hypothetical protein
MKYNPRLAQLIQERGETAGTPLFDPLTDTKTISVPKFDHLSALANFEFPANQRKSQTLIVLQALRILGTANDRMISEYTNIPRHLIPDRRGRLLGSMRIRFEKEATDPITKKKTAYWSVVS